MIRCAGRLIENRRVARDTLLLGLEANELAPSIGPGQFVMLGPLGAGHDPFLCRPLSVHRVVGDRLY
ncbi:MAG: dihydroorotate dehydrogenase, partial [Deltaproteobacteria bacterium]